MSKSPKSRKSLGEHQNWLLLGAVVALAIFPLVWIKGDYTGADGQAQDAIKELQPNYQPWFNSLITLPSKEVESLLFASQAALGAGVIGYVIGRYQERDRGRSQATLQSSVAQPELFIPPSHNESSD